MSGGDETFLKRWSRLKQARQHAPAPQGEAAPETAAKPAREPTPQPESQHAPAPRENRADEPDGDPEVVAKLPPVDSLTKDSDYTAFMGKGVPQALRLAALRKLWVSDPVIAAMETLDLHNLDYTHLAAPDQVVATSYQVGRGFVDKVEESIKRVEEERAKDEVKAIKSAEPSEPAKAADGAEKPPAPSGKPERPA